MSSADQNDGSEAKTVNQVQDVCLPDSEESEEGGEQVISSSEDQDESVDCESIYSVDEVPPELSVIPAVDYGPNLAETHVPTEGNEEECQDIYEELNVFNVASQVVKIYTTGTLPAI